MLAFLHGLHKEALDQVLFQALKEASVKGQFITNHHCENEWSLVNKYNFDPDTLFHVEDL